MFVFEAIHLKKYIGFMLILEPEILNKADSAIY